MTKKFYQGNSAIYQIVIDGDNCFIYQLKSPLSVRSATNAWDYITRTDSSKITPIMCSKLRVSNENDLKKKEISEDYVDSTISHYMTKNLS